MKSLKVLAFASIALMMWSCGSLVKAPAVQTVYLQEYNGAVSATYKDAEIPLKVRASYNSGSSAGGYRFTPAVGEFARSAAESYIDAIGLNLSLDADYVLELKVNRFDAVAEGSKSKTYNVSLAYTLVNEAGESVVPVSSVSAAVSLGSSVSAGSGFGRAYFAALQKINWSRIARILTVHKTAKEEKNKAVKGNGDTALEHTVIRWNIESRPQGADVSWRVVSSTPDVMNTNSNYVGNTPYESTESFDIKGLTYNNSGNVQIEVTCERNGYITQKKRFNLRQAIDQKEISAKFNLIKDE